jgi:hypothetical protein
MPTNYPAPADHTIETLFAGLVTAPTQVAAGAADDPGPDTTGIFAEFVTDDDELAALAYADHDVVNFVGGAMLGLEQEAMTDASDKSLVLDDGLEGFREVVNVFASCLNTDFTKHLRLREVHRLPGQLGDDVKQLWRQPNGRRAYRVSVDDVGAGNLILYLA